MMTVPKACQRSTKAGDVQMTNPEFSNESLSPSPCDCVRMPRFVWAETVRTAGGSFAA